MHETQASTSRVHLPEMHRAGYVRGMTIPNTLSRACFSILDGEHVRVLWSDLEAAFDLEGLAANPPLALIRNVLVRCGAPAWVWDAEAQIDQVGVMFRRASSRSAA
jgi:hypothetical protein